MNFKKWYNLTLAKEHTVDKLIASEHGWNACKKEVLKINNDNKSYRKSVFGYVNFTESLAKEIENLFQYGKGNSGETAFDLYNGVTEYVDHFRGKDDSSRLANSMIGSGAAMKTNAFEFLANY